MKSHHLPIAQSPTREWKPTVLDWEPSSPLSSTFNSSFSSFLSDPRSQSEGACFNSSFSSLTSTPNLAGDDNDSDLDDDTRALTSTFNASFSSFVSAPPLLGDAAADDNDNDDLLRSDQAGSISLGGSAPHERLIRPARKTGISSPRRSFRSTRRTPRSILPNAAAGLRMIPNPTRSRRQASRFPTRRHSTAAAEQEHLDVHDIQEYTPMPPPITNLEWSSTTVDPGITPLESSNRDSSLNTPSLHGTKAYSRRQDKHLRRQRRFSMTDPSMASAECISTGDPLPSDNSVAMATRRNRVVRRSHSDRPMLTLSQRLSWVDGRNPARAGSCKEWKTDTTRDQTVAANHEQAPDNPHDQKDCPSRTSSNSSASVSEWEIYAALADIRRKAQQ